jgi:hypothetical protein
LTGKRVLLIERISHIQTTWNGRVLMRGAAP